MNLSAVSRSIGHWDGPNEKIFDSSERESYINVNKEDHAESEILKR